MPKQDPIDFVNHLRLEIDSRNPRTRLAVLGALLENHPVTPDTLALAKDIADWVGEGVDDLLTDYLEDALNNIPEEEEVEAEDKSKPGYKYL